MRASSACTFIGAGYINVSASAGLLPGETAVKKQVAHHDDLASSTEPGRQEMSLLPCLSFCDTCGSFPAAHWGLCAEADSQHTAATCKLLADSLSNVCNCIGQLLS